MQKCTHLKKVVWAQCHVSAYCAAAAIGFGNRRHAMRANGNGYMAQIRVRLGAAAINMIIPLEGMKEARREGGREGIWIYCTHWVDSDRGNQYRAFRQK